jgi:hypothetical protein
MSWIGGEITSDGCYEDGGCVGRGNLRRLSCEDLLDGSCKHGCMGFLIRLEILWRRIPCERAAQACMITEHGNFLEGVKDAKVNFATDQFYYCQFAIASLWTRQGGRYDIPRDLRRLQLGFYRCFCAINSLTARENRFPNCPQQPSPETPSRIPDDMKPLSLHSRIDNSSVSFTGAVPTSIHIVSHHSCQLHSTSDS